MSPKGEAGFVLTQKELLFLAALTGADEMYGVEDVFSQIDDEQVIKEWDIAREQLENKKYLEVEFDNTITMDNELYSLMVACCNPKVFMRVLMIEDESFMHIRNIYINENIAVELDQDRLSKNKWIMTPLVSIEKVAENLKECFFTETNYEGGDIGFEVPLPDFEKLNDLVVKGDRSEGIEVLKKNGCSDEAAGDLFDAIKDKDFCVSLLIMLLDYDNMSDVNSYTCYGGSKYLWMLDASAIVKEDEKEMVMKFNTLGKEAMLVEIEKMVFALRNLYSSASEGDV
ncbi:MAG: hypothetical protein BWY74_03167 [Firmicutes bacterium ADurb.Bin419]|nr:MAG: hypothetical protein BWY74_03167 [Firmicutes bacterium ADurb.Bin419]